MDRPFSFLLLKCLLSKKGKEVLRSSPVIQALEFWRIVAMLCFFVGFFAEGRFSAKFFFQLSFPRCNSNNAKVQ